MTSRTVPGAGTAVASGRSTDALLELAAIADSVSAHGISAFARAAAERVAEGRFFLACVGQFKRGKSTLINALAGREILPTGVAPVTSVPTVVRYGPQLSARVRFATGVWIDVDPATISAYVSEDENPGNEKSVAAVEVFAPGELLEMGVNLVDTPGLGSVFAANSAATREFIPHIDAALVVLGADPPISGEERALVAALAPPVGEILFVLNKSDRVSGAESTAAAEFTRRVLCETLGRANFHLFHVSARERCDCATPTRDWQALESALRDLCVRSGRSLVDAANRRAFSIVAARLLAILRNERRTLTEPLEQSEQRIAALEATLRDAQSHLGDLSALLAAQQQRITAASGQRREAFLRTAMRACREKLRERSARFHRRRNGRALRRALNRVAQQIVHAELAPFLERETAAAESAFTTATARFSEAGNEFLRRISATGVAGLDALSDLELDAPALHAPSQFRFHSIERVAAPASPFGLVRDLAFGALGLRAPFLKSAGDFIAQLLETNSARVQNDLARRVAESRATLESAIRTRLNEASAIATRSLTRARALHAEGSSAVATALSQIDATTARVQPISQAGRASRED